MWGAQAHVAETRGDRLMGWSQPGETVGWPSTSWRRLRAAANLHRSTAPEWRLFAIILVRWNFTIWKIFRRAAASAEGLGSGWCSV